MTHDRRLPGRRLMLLCAAAISVFAAVTLVPASLARSAASLGVTSMSVSSDVARPAPALLSAGVRAVAADTRGGGVDAVATVLSACPRSYFCFWDGPGFTGHMGKLRGCGMQYLSTWGWQYRVASAFYNIDSGSVDFRWGSTTLFRISAGNRSSPDAGGYAGAATNVVHYC